MTALHSSELDDFVRMVDEKYAGNLNDSELAALYYPLSFGFDTTVNQDLDPFSAEYYHQQLKLYADTSGRELDQWSGELHPVHIDSLLETPNPLGIRNVPVTAEHSRAISSMLVLACVEPVAEVLDMGAGHGLSSEVLAFCGAKVHAIDIDPARGELSVLRAKARSLDIRRSVLNYDDLSAVEVDHYDAAFFFQSLRHCLRPWELVATLAEKLKEGGIIAFTGEPIGSVWRHWGMRLDQESVYVARKFGWFESGWSHSFLSSCFERNGYAMKFFSGGHGGGDIGAASRSVDRLDACTATAAAIGYVERNHH